jgi:lipopolysaccharide transport system ATP-binding protein
MSSEVAVRADHLSKCYFVYDSPQARLKQFVVPRLQRWTGRKTERYFQEFWALRDVSFEVTKGESFGIVGRNGSGKSTLLQMIAGTLRPTTGEIQYNGRLAALLELGSGFNPEFSGRDNVYLSGALLGLSRREIDDRFDAIASFADIGTYLDQPVKSYSSGMVVRLAMAVQTQINPEVLIVDEALAVGDALFQKRCFRQWERMLSDGCTLLFVSHDQEIVRNLTQRAILLDRGQMICCGPTQDVLFRYRQALQEQDEADYQKQLATEPVAANPVRQGKAYGNLEVEIQSVKTVNAAGEEQQSFTVGETLGIAINCRANRVVRNLNVAYRLRNKEGVKITTWGTLNEDMRKSDSEMFWNREFHEGEDFTVTFTGPCILSENFYEIEAVIALEYDRFYNNQRILHWKDEAAHFRVSLIPRKHVFDGVVDLGLRSNH